jgi:hypothetical protein
MSVGQMDFGEMSRRPILQMNQDFIQDQNEQLSRRERDIKREIIQDLFGPEFSTLS